MKKEVILNDIEGFMDGLAKESARAKIILTAALLDKYLYEVLLAFFADNKNEASLLLGVDRPLGGYVARARTAYLLGLIGGNIYRDLKRIGRIRNRMAHELHDVAANSPEIVALCESLEFVNSAEKALDITFPGGHMAKFGIEGFLLRMVFMAMLKEAEESRRLVRADAGIEVGDEPPEEALVLLG